MPTAYTYGSFNMNDNINYFMIEKDSESAPVIAETLFKVGRLEGVKKTGELVNEKTITVKLRVLGISRSDLESKIDTMLQALELRQQQLSLHAVDARYWVADCIEKNIPLAQGSIISTVATLKFLCQQPYALANAASNFTMANQTLSVISGTTYKTTTQAITGGGNVFARPTLVITAHNATALTQIQIQQTTDSQFLIISSNLPTALNDTLTIVGDPYAANGYTVYKNGVTATLSQISGLFPVQEPTSTNWIIQATAGATAPQFSCVWTWTPRWVS